jgi:hypothetical protein
MPLQPSGRASQIYAETLLINNPNKTISHPVRKICFGGASTAPAYLRGNFAEAVRPPLREANRVLALKNKKITKKLWTKTGKTSKP